MDFRGTISVWGPTGEENNPADGLGNFFFETFDRILGYLRPMNRNFRINSGKYHAGLQDHSRQKDQGLLQLGKNHFQIASSHFETLFYSMIAVNQNFRLYNRHD